MHTLSISSRMSLPAQVADVLREGLAEGRWYGTLPGERKLCAQLGVSRPTLRKALAQLRSRGLVKIAQGRRSKLTRKAVRHEAHAESGTVIVLTPEALDRLPASIVYIFDQLRENLAQAGLHLEVRGLHSPKSKRSAHSLETLYATDDPSACLLYQAERPVHRWFRARGLPCVVFGTQDEAFPLPAVDLDQRATCRHAAHVLLRAGFAAKQIVLVLPHGELPGHALMRAGFHDALGVEAPVVEIPNEPASLPQALDRLFPKPVHRGLIFARAGQATAALGHFGIRRGWQIPEDVALISLSDDPFLRHVQPVLARYHRDEVAVARQISTLVIRAATGNVLPPRMALLMPEFIPGETVAISAISQTKPRS